MVHADLFMNPTAELADIVLPVASAFETEALRVGFEVSEAAQAYVQLRQRVVPPRGEARSDIEIVFDLANRLGLGDRFFGGDVEAAWRYQIAPSGVTIEALRAQPHGIRTPVVSTPVGSVRARARLNDALQKDVVCGQHGWWAPCEELGAPGYDPYGPDGANLNLIIDRRAVDPVSGTAPHRSFMCQVAPAAPA